jgi:hypothetical protein
VKLRRSFTADPETEWWQAFTEFTQLFICSWMKFCFAGKDKYFDPYWLLEYLGKAKMRVKHFSSNWLYVIDRVARKKATNCSITFFFFFWRYNPLWVCILQPSSGAIASSRTRFLDLTQRRATVGRTPLDE